MKPLHSPSSSLLISPHSSHKNGSLSPCCPSSSCGLPHLLPLGEPEKGEEIFSEGGGYSHSPLFLWNVISSHCWPLLTPPPRDTPLPRYYANLCCAPNRCPNNSLSGGGGGKLRLWQEKNAAIFMAGPDYHTAEDFYLGGGCWFRHTFPTIQISWVVKKK